MVACKSTYLYERLSHWICSSLFLEKYLIRDNPVRKDQDQCHERANNASLSLWLKEGEQTGNLQHHFQPLTNQINPCLEMIPLRLKEFTGVSCSQLFGSSCGITTK